MKDRIDVIKMCAKKSLEHVPEETYEMVETAFEAVMEILVEDKLTEVPSAHKGSQLLTIIFPVVRNVTEQLYVLCDYVMTTPDVEDLYLYIMDTYFNPLMANPLRRWLKATPNMEISLLNNLCQLYVANKLYTI
jgi:hypothetical protein